VGGTNKILGGLDLCSRKKSGTKREASILSEAGEKMQNSIWRVKVWGSRTWGRWNLERIATVSQGLGV